MSWTKQLSTYLKLALICQGFFVLVGCSNEVKQVEKPVFIEEVSSQEQSFSSETENRINQFFQSLNQKGQFNGVLLIAQNDSVFSSSYGYKRFSDTLSLDTSDLFQLGSVTKPVTAYGLLQLFERSGLDIDRTVSSFLPLFYDSTITVRQLLNHRSGIGNYLYMTDSLWGFADSAISNREVQCYFEESKIPAYYTPNKTFNYCNSNYALVASIIESVSQKPFRDYMRDSVFLPLNMRQTHYIDMVNKDCLSYPVYGHYPNRKKKLPLYVNGVVGDKGLYSSVTELYRFSKEIFDPEMISDSLRDEMVLINEKIDDNGTYGLGWRVKLLGNRRVVYHNGWWRGFRAYFWMDMESKITVIILTNHIIGGYLNQSEVFNLLN